MKKKELKELAVRIAECEKAIQENKDIISVSQAQDEIMKLTAKVKSLSDLDLLDEMIQEILK